MSGKPDNTWLDLLGAEDGDYADVNDNEREGGVEEEDTRGSQGDEEEMRPARAEDGNEGGAVDADGDQGESAPRASVSSIGTFIDYGPQAGIPLHFGTLNLAALANVDTSPPLPGPRPQLGHNEGEEAAALAGALPQPAGQMHSGDDDEREAAVGGGSFMPGTGPGEFLVPLVALEVLVADLVEEQVV